MRKLSSMIAEQEQNVQQLTAKNEILQSSDEQLRSARELKWNAERQSRLSEQAIRKAEASAEECKRTYQRKAEQAENELKEAVRLQEQTKERIEERSKALYARKTAMYSTAFTLSILYGVGATIATAARTVRFRDDFVKTFKSAFHGISKLVGFVVHKGLVWEIVSSVILISAIVGLIFGISAFASFFKEHMADSLTVFVLYVSLIVFVWFGDLIGGVISYNLFVIYLSIVVGYFVLRVVLDNP